VIDGNNLDVVSLIRPRDSGLVIIELKIFDDGLNDTGSKVDDVVISAPI
jgi:hypothetical protein